MLLKNNILRINVCDYVLAKASLELKILAICSQTRQNIDGKRLLEEQNGTKFLTSRPFIKQSQGKFYNGKNQIYPVLTTVRLNLGKY